MSGYIFCGFFTESMILVSDKSLNIFLLPFVVDKKEIEINCILYGMPKKLNYQLGPEELRAIKQVMKSSKAKVMRWATILYNLHLGSSPQQVADANNVSLSMVYGVVKRYQDEGIEGLQPSDIPGRPYSLTPTQCEEIERLLEIAPTDLGYGFTIWTSQRIQLYIEERMGVIVTEGTVRNTLQRMGYVYRRPKKSLKHVQDEDEVERFKELLTELKKEHKPENLSSCLWMKVDLNLTTLSDPAG